MKYKELIEGKLLDPKPGDIIFSHGREWTVIEKQFDRVNGIEYYCSTWMVSGKKEVSQTIRQTFIEKILRST